MRSVRKRLIGFPWIPSFIVSLLAGGIFFIAEHPSILENIWSSLYQSKFLQIIQFSSMVISLAGLLVSGLAFYLQRRQKELQEELKEDLVEYSENHPHRDEVDNLEDITKTQEDILSEQVSRISDYVWLSESGDINIRNINDLESVQRILLYLVAKRYASKLGYKDSPKAKAKEISQATEINPSNIRTWKMVIDGVIQKKHHDEIFKVNDYWVDIEDLPEAIDYITGDQEISYEIQ